MNSSLVDPNSTISKTVAICIATYKRPQSLARLLDSINHLDFEESAPPAIQILVADNDKSGSAQSVCNHARKTSKWAIIYSIEPRQGVSFARNCSIKLADDDVDFFAFIDDDEIPARHWLDRLLFTQAKHDAAIVTGPVHPKFESPNVPPWILKGGFFMPTDKATGTVMNVAFTNNSLAKSQLLKQFDPPFNEELAFRGSEDTHLFMTLFKQGAKIIWDNDAIVYEFIPEARTQIKWLLDSAFFGWSSHSVVERKLFPSWRIQSTRTIKGGGMLLFGGLRFFPSLFLGKHEWVKSLVYMSRGLGTLSGLVGIQGAWGGANR